MDFLQLYLVTLNFDLRLDSTSLANCKIMVIKVSESCKVFGQTIVDELCELTERMI